MSSESSNFGYAAMLVHNSCKNSTTGIACHTVGYRDAENILWALAEGWNAGTIISVSCEAVDSLSIVQFISLNKR